MPLPAHLLAAALLVAPADAPQRSADEVLYYSLREVIHKGVDLYNGGEPGACYRLFEGSLMAIKPTLDRHPDLQKAIDKGLAAAEKDPVVWRRAFKLREVLDKVRAELKPKDKNQQKPKPAEGDKEKPRAEEKAEQLERLPMPKKVEEDKKADEKKDLEKDML